MDAQGTKPKRNVNHMRIAFRTDASVQIGTGHVMRCLSLAKALREKGAICRFICRDHPGNLLDFIRQQGFEAEALPMPEDQQPLGETEVPALAHAAWLGCDWTTDVAQTKAALGGTAVDWLIVDHYALDARWERALAENYCRLMVIDDLADRPHECDLLLDQNLGRTQDDYNGLLPARTATLIGPHYALLRPEFAQLRIESLARRAKPQLKQLLITMGGVDKDNATGRVLDALRSCVLPPDLQITVVMGPHAPWLKKVQEQAAQMPWPTQILAGVNDMARLMTGSDLAIGAAGGTAWERCCLGLPALVVVLAANQRAGAVALHKAGAAIALQSPGEIPHVMQNKLLDGAVALLQQMSLSAARLTAGKGVCQITERLMCQYD